MNNVVSLSIEETRENGWVLWKFLVSPQTKRFIWILNGQFPCYLFDETVIINKLNKTYDNSIEEKNRAEEQEKSNAV